MLDWGWETNKTTGKSNLKMCAGELAAYQRKVVFDGCFQSSEDAAANYGDAPGAYEPFLFVPPGVMC